MDATTHAATATDAAGAADRRPPPPTVWPCLVYRDARAALAFATEAFGFVETLVVADDDAPDVVHHAELRWPEGGGVMLGSAGAGEVLADLPAGHGAAYVVCTDPDTLFARATAAGAEVLAGLRDEEYGSRGFTVRDPQGVVWSFGTYVGAT